MSTVDVLAIFAHRDDAELNAGGTLVKLGRQGRRTGILDLTQGEMGTRGSAATRAAEAAEAANVLGIAVRENLELPDAGITNTPETRRAVAAVIRRLKPQVVIAPARKVLHALSFREDHEKPTFVVDISDEFETKLAAIKCYASQFDGAIQGGEVFPNGEPLYDIIRHQAAHYGSLIRCRYGEPFHTAETMRVDDLMALEVETF